MHLRRAAVVALLCACSTKLPTKERSTSPPPPEPSATVQPDPEPFDDEGGTPFGDAGGTSPYDAGCPDALPEAGSDCHEWKGAFDCPYGDVECTCKSTPEADWWSCAPP